MQCENMKMQCEQLEELKYERCQAESERDQEQCQWRLAMKGKEEKWYDCPTSSCTNEVERCEGKHRTCYQACGGKVTAKTVCVMNCDQIPEGQTVPVGN